MEKLRIALRIFVKSARSGVGAGFRVQEYDVITVT